MPQYVLGISAYFHDSACALLGDGEIIAAAQEERFTRRKADERFPKLAVKSVLETAGIEIKDLSSVVYYEKPWLAFSRIIENAIEFAPNGLSSFLKAAPSWLDWKLNIRGEIQKELAFIDKAVAKTLPILFSSHHLSHAASAYYPSGFNEAVVLCLDGVGEYATTSAWMGKQSNLTPLWEIRFPHSLGLLYAAFTWFCGFKINSGEYKLMGLAPFGEPRFKDLILKELIQVNEDGTFRLNMKYFNFHTGLRMVSKRFGKLFGVAPRPFEGPMEDIYKDMAASIQAVTEEIMVRLARTLRQECGVHRLCMAGGVALNCVANGRILEEEIFDEIFIQPAAGDAGGALGAALAAWYLFYENAKPTSEHRDLMKGALLGPRFSSAEVEREMKAKKLQFHKLSEAAMNQKVAGLLNDGKVVGWFQGRMEFGPRALGSRSILGDARKSDMQKTMNLKIKFREGFRPFAPIVLEEKATSQFALATASPYMLFTAKSLHPQALPAITHVDQSARVQTVSRVESPRLHALLTEFERLTGTPVLINTSFNVRGEPIVMNPEQAISCFLNTDIDVLAIEDILVTKADNPQISKNQNWRENFELD